MSECYPDTDNTLSPADRRNILERRAVALQREIRDLGRRVEMLVWHLVERGTATTEANAIRRLAALVEECSRLIRELDAMPEEDA